jgi:hypothetical protein
MRKQFVPLFALISVLALVALVRPAVAAPLLQRMELMAQLRGGAEEVPGPGDPDGMGTAMVTLDMAGGQASFTINVSNITLPAAAAHIHEGARGVAGPVVVPLMPPGANGSSSSSVSVDAALMERIRQNPAGFYVNVHTSDFPGGAVRGQLSMSGSRGGAPTTMPAAGASIGTTSLLAGLALLVLAAGLGLSVNVRRRAGTR